MKKYDYTVFIGRFQPFHYGHAKVIETALEYSQKVIILVGSSGAARDWRNPFTFEERADVVHAWMKEEVSQLDAHRLIIIPLVDHMYNNQGWITEVQTLVTGAIHADSRVWTDRPPRVALIGHSKDHTSYYLSLFPQWDTVDVPAFTDRHLFNSTDVRNAYFGENSTDPKNWAGLLGGLPKATFRFLDAFRHLDDYQRLREEHLYLLKYQEDHSFKGANHKATHTTVDACVVQSGHTLVVERGANPGKGLLAMAGGFIDEDETLEDGMLRELREETKLKVPTPVLRGNIRKREVFDDPHRSGRGRIFSHTFLIVLPADPKGLPKVKGSSDAKKAFWMPLSDVRPDMFFEDHYHIIKKMTGDL